MRCFVSVSIPKELREKLAKVQKELPSGARGVPLDNLHVTLSFLGKKSEREVESLRKALRGIKFEAFTVRLEGVGCFPSTRKARIVWIGVKSKKLEELARLVKKVVGGEDARFVGHLTIARCAEVDVSKLAKLYKERKFKGFEVASFELMKSELTPEGSKYGFLETFTSIAVAVLKCPKCKGKTKLEVPSDRCLAFYTCQKCKELIPATKSCCVVCDYSDKKCPGH